MSIVDGMSQTVSPPLFPFARPEDELFAPPLGGEGAAVGAVGRVVLPTGQWAWLVTRHDDVRKMLRNPAFSADMTRPGFPHLRPMPDGSPRDRAGTFIRMDAPEHTRLRRIVTPEFMIRNMKRLEPLIHRTVTDALDRLRDAGPPADLIEWFALPVPSVVICHLLGVPYADHEFFQAQSRVLIRHTNTVEDVREAAQALRGYLNDLVAAKQRAGGSDDLIGRLAIERVATGQISADEAVGIAVLLLIAGHETTANMIGLSTLLLLQRCPAEFAALRTDPGLVSTMVEELLRYLTIVRTGLPRVAVEDVELGGQLIRAGEGVIASLSDANHDDVVFTDADEFDARRGGQPHMAFGFGVHQCIGQPLARSELGIALVELATRFPRLAIAGPLDGVRLRDDSVVYGVDRLLVTW